MAAVGKFVWQVAQKEDVLWIKWIHSVYIKDQGWWEYKAPASASWIWKGVCKAKDILKDGYHNNNWGNGSKKYTAKEGYNWLKGQYATVGWHHWVWSGINVPKHAFISWMVALRKVKTKERLKAAGVCQDEACLLCITGTDSCMHLFFRCYFSRTVCSSIMNWLQIHVGQQECLYSTWKKWGRKYRSKKQQQVCYCALDAIVYHIWRARNHSLWEGVVLSPDRVVQSIKQEVIGRVNWVMQTWPDDVKTWFNNLST
ncbi:uncharacterized protein LOC125498738 [Beta vulgaris subsp. vulgaris]|uniref:uncharacterized protein LOC125498738 n=1 Tax=Beta vulgaris subsp. vulgaris TaxID=3555 RepID=UPI00203709E8|nr:uncharacterized protein LOC125498738 [Beta vulgaris subsp. vulgaris]